MALAAGACDRTAHRVLTFDAPSQIAEGTDVHLAVHLTNIHPYPIIPLTLTVYARPDATAYLAGRRVIAETRYYTPLEATEVRHHQTLDRIVADHIRDGNHWRHVPFTRFLHPRVLMPGNTLSETVTFLAIAPYQRDITCAVQYLPLNDERFRARLFVRNSPRGKVPPEADRYTEVFVRLPADQLGDLAAHPSRYLLYRPPRIHDWPPVTLTRRLQLPIRPQPFSYTKAARRARVGQRIALYFQPLGAWVFQYADDGTWFITPDRVVKLAGRYADLVEHIHTRNAATLTLTAPRKPGDKLLRYFQQAGYADPKAKGPNAVATIPADKLPDVLQQAETLGYLITKTTWKPAP